MRDIIIFSFITIDGVMQAPGDPTEDTSGGFKYGGWNVPYFHESLGNAMMEQISKLFDLLLGRKTYEIFASYWPNHNNANDPMVSNINKVSKYVASHFTLKFDWGNSIQLANDVSGEIEKLKSQDGPELQVHGSGNFIQTLLKHDLIDKFWLKIFPVTLGAGKRLFAEGTIPAAFRLTKSSVTPAGVIIANYERSGEVKTGSF
jgi:dihydrofolate reductase